MLFRYIAILTGVLMLIVSISACGGPAATPDISGASPVFTATGSFPALPTEPLEPRASGMVDGAVFDGDSCTAFHGGILISGEARLESTAVPVDIGWALYQIPEPVDPPYAVTVEATFMDPDPDTGTDRDGYWIAYGNFDKGAWEFNGPFTQHQARVFFKPGVDVVSGGGDVTIAVFCENGNRVNVEKIQLGTDAGPGYDVNILGRTSGAFVGEWADIQVDSAGNPHVIYNVSPIMMYASHMLSQLRYAYHDGTVWHVEEFETPMIDSVRWARLALGDGGRRAVLVKDRGATDDLYLYYDDGGGTFADLGSVAVGPVNQCFAGIGFINSADNPFGDRDLLIFTYQIVTAHPNTQTHYRTYDGVVLSPEQNLYPLASNICGRIELCVGPDKNAVAGVPDEAGGWRYYIGTYSAVADLWDFATITSWIPPDPLEDTDDYRPDFSLRQIPGGDIIASCLLEDEEFIRFARWDGAVWQTTDQDLIPTYDGLSDYISEFEVFSTGQAVALVPFGSGSPLLAFGTVGSGTDWFRSYLTLDTWSMMQGNLAVDAANNTHVVVVDFLNGGLRYYRRDAASHEITSELIDNGGDSFGYCFGFAFPVWAEGRLHLFYADEPNHCIRHSVNNGGVWEIEHEAVSTSDLQIPYMVLGAGYLEDTGLLYAVYIDILTMAVYAVTGPPDGSDWQTNKIAETYIPPVAVADNGSEVAIMGVALLMMEGSVPMFAAGDPRGGVFESEVVTFARHQISYPFHLAYNSFIGQWCVASPDSDGRRANYFLRAPAGNWVGPFLVAQEFAPAGEVEVGGITANKVSGEVRITLTRQASGDPVNHVWVYSAPNGSASFTPTQELIAVDTTTHDYRYCMTVNKGDGEPIVAVVYKPIADPGYDVRFFAPSAPATWSNIGAWDSDFHGFYMGLALDNTGRIICTGIEMEGDPEVEGRVFVRYPW